MLRHAFLLVACVALLPGCRHELSSTDAGARDARADGAADGAPGDDTGPRPPDGPPHDVLAGRDSADRGIADRGTAPIDGLPPRPDGLPPRPDGLPPRPDGLPPPPDGLPPPPDGLPSPLDSTVSLDARCGLSAQWSTSSCTSRVVGGEASCTSAALTRAVPSDTSGRFSASCASGSGLSRTRCVSGLKLLYSSALGTASADRSCEPGQTLLGGGCACLDGLAVLLKSYPLRVKTTPTGWSCTCTSGALTVMTVCAADADLGCADVNAVWSPGPSVSCAPDEVALSGGCEAAGKVTQLQGSGERIFSCSGTQVTRVWAVCAKAL